MTKTWMGKDKGKHQDRDEDMDVDMAKVKFSEVMLSQIKVKITFGSSDAGKVPGCARQDEKKEEEGKEKETPNSI